MDYSGVQNIVTIILLCGFACIAAFGAAHFVYLNYRGWKQRKLPVQTARATVYCKYPDPEYVSGSQNIHATSSGYIYYITFHTDTGEVLKLYLNPKPFFAIEENAVGQLTWQGGRFWNFVPEEKEEE